MIKLLSGAAAMLLAAAPAAAATLTVNGDGKLTGATGVLIGTTLYDVSFLDSSCVDIFSGCDANSDFDFPVIADASAAGQALLDQVFIDGSAGQFDSDPSRTFGCSLPSQCITHIPFRVDAGVASAIAAINETGIDFVSAGGAGTNVSFAAISNTVYAKFTVSQTPPVPEPAIWAMMIAGFGLVGGAMRRMKETTRLTPTY